MISPGLKSFLKGFNEFLLVGLGMTIYSVGWSLFLVPLNLVGGGVTGLASIVQYATGIKMGITYFAVNIGLLILALFTLGKSFGGKTVFAVILCSVELNLFQDIMPPTLIQSLAIENGKLMCTIMGGLCVGLGVGISMSQGGSSGGTDIIALIVNKYRGVSPGRMLLMMDVFIILSSLLVPSYTADGELLPMVDKITVVVYAAILTVIVSTAVDLYLSGTKQSVQLFILSEKSDEIAEGIARDLRRGVTVLNGKGWYTQQDRQVLMVLTRKADLNIFLRYVRNIDPDVFMSVSSVMGVYGKGFDQIKTRSKK